MSFGTELLDESTSADDGPGAALLLEEVSGALSTELDSSGAAVLDSGDHEVARGPSLEASGGGVPGAVVAPASNPASLAGAGLGALDATG